jgi:hypothetical protein
MLPRLFPICVPLTRHGSVRYNIFGSSALTAPARCMYVTHLAAAICISLGLSLAISPTSTSGTDFPPKLQHTHNTINTVYCNAIQNCMAFWFKGRQPINIHYRNNSIIYVYNCYYSVSASPEPVDNQTVTLYSSWKQQEQKTWKDNSALLKWRKTPRKLQGTTKSSKDRATEERYNCSC